MKTMSARVAMVATCVLGLTAGCGSAGDDTSGAADTIQIGVVLDTTGPLASLGVPHLNGVQLAVDQANEAGGIDGKQVELVTIDGTSDSTVAAAAARTLSSQVDVVIGASSGAACRAMQPVLDRAGVLQYCLSPQPFEQTPLFFWSSAPVTDYVAATQPWLTSLDVQRIAFIGQQDASGDGYLSIFTALAQQYPDQFQIVAEERFNSGSANLEPQMANIRAADPDLIVAGTSGANIVPIVQAARTLGLDQSFWVGTGSASVDALSPLDNDLPPGGLFANAFWVDVADEVPTSVPYADAITSFAAAYSADHGRPDVLAAGAYDATEQILQALESGATTGQEIADHIESSAFTGVLGPYEFSADQHQGASMVDAIMQYTGGDSGFRLSFSGA